MTYLAVNSGLLFPASLTIVARRIIVNGGGGQLAADLKVALKDDEVRLLGRPPLEEIDWTMGLEINQDRGVHLAATKGEIIDAEDSWGWHR